MEKITSKGKDKAKITIIVLSILVAISLSVTVYFAAFHASRSGSITLHFADGLTMRIDPLGTSGRISFVAADENATTFSYTPVSDAKASVYLDGINATINRDAWIAVRFELQELVNDSYVAADVYASHGSNYAYLNPNDHSDWNSMLSYSGVTNFVATSSLNTITLTNQTISSASSSPIKLFEYVVIWGKTLHSYVNALSGRSFRYLITIKASTASAPTFS